MQPIFRIAKPLCQEYNNQNKTYERNSDYEIIRRGQYERQFEKLIRNRITKLHYDTDNHVLWIGTYGNGFKVYDVANDENVKLYEGRKTETFFGAQVEAMF